MEVFIGALYRCSKSCMGAGKDFQCLSNDDVPCTVIIRWSIGQTAT